MGKIIFDENLFYDYTKNWSNNKPVIDDVTQNGNFNSVTGALASVGLGVSTYGLDLLRYYQTENSLEQDLQELYVKNQKK